MDIKVNRVHLASVVKKFSGFVAKKSTIPILSGVQFSTQDGKLFLSATDLEKRLTIHLAPCEASVNFVVPFAKLNAQAQLAKADEVSLQHDGTTLTMKSGRSKVKFNTFNGEDYPAPMELKDPVSAEVSGSKYLEGVKFAARFVAVNDARLVMHGVNHYVKDSSLVMVASDGKGLGWASADVSQALNNYVLPTPCAQVLDVFSGVDTLTIHTSSAMVRYEGGGMTLDSKIVEGNYPNVQQVVDGAMEQANHSIVFDCGDFHDLAAPIYAACGDSVVRVMFGKDVSIKSQGGDASADNAMPAFSHSGDEVEFIFSPDGLTKAMYQGHANIRFGVSERPVTFNYDNKMAILMPLRTK